ncbi:unnamed protein product [Rhizophagus irregularis]|nr:unnamed protein product [Rhizophagus irregularis]
MVDGGWWMVDGGWWMVVDGGWWWMVVDSGWWMVDGGCGRRTVQIVHNNFDDFFGNDRPKLDQLSSNIRQFEIWTKWTILTSGGRIDELNRQLDNANGELRDLRLDVGQLQSYNNILSQENDGLRHRRSSDLQDIEFEEDQ